MMDKSVFTNNNNTNNSNTWGNPQLGNKPFTFPNTNQSAFSGSIWGNNNNNSTNTNNNGNNKPKQDPFKSATFQWGNNNTTNTNQPQSVFGNTNANNNEQNNNSNNSFGNPNTNNTNTWWSNPNTQNNNKNNNKNNKNNNNNKNTNNNNSWPTNNNNNNGWQRTNTVMIDDNDKTMEGDSGMMDQSQSQSQTPNHNQSQNNQSQTQITPPNHNQFQSNNFNNNNNNNNKKSPPLKSKKYEKLEATRESQLFCGNWTVKPRNTTFLTIKHKQNDPNLLVGLTDSHPKYEIQVTDYGKCTRIDLNNKNKNIKLNGILHLNPSRSGQLSILWYDNNKSHIHYWNQSKCNKNPCPFNKSCKFAHINDNIKQLLNNNNNYVQEIQNNKHKNKNKNKNKNQQLQNKNQPPYKNKIYTYNNQQQQVPPPPPDTLSEKGSLVLTSGVRFSPKRSKTNTPPKPYNNGHKKPPFKNKTYIYNQTQTQSQTPPKKILPKQLKSYKNPKHKTEGMSFTTTYFNINGISNGTFISTQNPSDTNTIKIPQSNTNMNTNNNNNNASFNYSFEDDSNNNSNNFSQFQSNNKQNINGFNSNNLQSNNNEQNGFNSNNNFAQFTNNNNKSEINAFKSNNNFSQFHKNNKNNNNKSHSRSKSPSSDEYSKPGCCYLMCPLSESQLRLNSGQCKKFEIDINLNKPTKYSLIKEYSKSNAGQLINLNDVRCGSVLKLTMSYLMNIILNNISIPYAKRFVFLEDRIRAIVKDIYVQHLSIFDKETTIQLFEISIRFRIFSHLLICHMDQHIIQQNIPFPKTTKYSSEFLNQNINNKNPFKQQYQYSAHTNLEHLPNIFSNLFSLYKCRNYNSLSSNIASDEIEMYCLSAYNTLVSGAISHANGMNNNYIHAAKDKLFNISIPHYIRKHKRIKLAQHLLNAYNNMNNILFFKLYNNKLTIIEQAILFPILDRFRIICIKKMCNNKCVRMVGNTSYKLQTFIKHFGFYNNNNNNISYDANDFLQWYGGFNENNMNRICNIGLNMDDLNKIKIRVDAQRFPARDGFLIHMEKYSCQQLMEGASYNKINFKQFQNVFHKIEYAKNINIVDHQINQLLNNKSNAMFPPKIQDNNVPTRPFTSAFQIPDSSNKSKQETTDNKPNANPWGGGWSIPSSKPKPIEKTDSMQVQPQKSQQSHIIQLQPIIEIPTHEPLNKIISLYDRTLQSMVQNEEWIQLKQKLSEIKTKYKETHPKWNGDNGLEKWYKKYKSQMKIAFKNDYNELKNDNNKRNWLKYYNFKQKWKLITAPEILRKVYQSIENKWYRFKINNIIYYNNQKYTINNITFNTSTQPILHLSNNTQLNMFDTNIMSHKQYLLQQEKIKIQRKIRQIEQAKEQERLRIEKEKLQEKIEQEKKRKIKQENERIEKERKLKEEKQKQLAKLRAKLEAEQRKKQQQKAKEELQRKRLMALRKCNAIFRELKLKRFIAEWREKAMELSTIRKHYRLNSNDEVLTGPSSMDKTLELLQAHSPAQNRNRKRKSPDIGFDDHECKNLNIKRLKFMHKIQNAAANSTWDYKQIINDLSMRNKDALEVMLKNSDNIGYNEMRPMDLVFNILVSRTEDDRLNELVLGNLGFNKDNIGSELLKKVYVNDNGDKRLHYCVISDAKIKSIGATMDNCIRGFQSYIHLCGDVTALLDFDENGVWKLNTQYLDGLIVALKKERMRVAENMRLVHMNSECSVLILMKCQPFLTNLRDDINAVGQMIEFSGEDFETIMNAFDIGNNWPVKIIGIPWWNNMEYLKSDEIFKYCMDWMVNYSPIYPKLYKISSNMVTCVFEKIFDSKPGLLTREQKLMFWNGEIEKIYEFVSNGINLNVSWPPCCFDNQHELVINNILPISNWNSNGYKMKLLKLLKNLMIDINHINVSNMDIVKRISQVNEYWWCINDIKKELNNVFMTNVNSNNNNNNNVIDSSMSDTSTFNYNDIEHHEHEHEEEDNTNSVNSTQLSEFQQLVEDISCDFNQTLHGLQGCSDIAAAINTRINDLQSK